MGNSQKSLPSGWIKTTINEVADIVTGNTPSPKYLEFYGGDIPFVRPGDLIYQNPISVSEKMVTPEGLAQGRLLPKGSVLVSCIGILGKVGILGTDGICNQQINAILPNRHIFSEFILNWARTIAPWLESNSSATTVAIINKGRFSKAPIYLPPYGEQKRIAKKIETLREKSNNIRKYIEEVLPLVENLRQSVLSSAFRGDLTADWRVQNPNAEPATKLLERIRKERRKRWEEDELAKMKAKGTSPKDDKWKKSYKEPAPVDTTDLPELPEGWCWVALEELSAKVTDGTHQSPPFSDYGVPFLVIRNIIKGKIDWKGVNKWVTEETHDKFTSNCKPEHGDVLYSAVGSYGVAVEVEESGKFMFQRHIAHIKPLKNVISSTYITLALNSPYSLAQAHKAARGVAQQTVSLTYLRRFNLALPPDEEQCVIIERVKTALDQVDKVKNFVDVCLSQIQQLDQSILAKAFNGQLVPQDPNDEPASQLLNRIKLEKAVLVKEKKSSPRRKRGTQQKESRKVTKKNERRSLTEVLQPHLSGLSPESLFQQAGFDKDRVDEFYAELKNEVALGNIVEDRPDQEQVLLRLRAA